MISPTPGRIVWFTPSARLDVHFDIIDPTAPLVAIVCHVWHDRQVNLAVFDSNGTPHRMVNVPLLQDDDPKPEGGFFCYWMPFQIGQARKYESETTPG